MDLTINDIARLAGVSKATVSRVMNHKGQISEATRAKVMAVIRENNYHPNAYAQAVSNQQSRSACIAVVVPHSETYIMANPIFAEIFRGISDVLTSRGYYSFSCFTDSEEYLSSLYLQRRVDGLIFLSPTEQEAPLLTKLRELGVPYVSTTSYDAAADTGLHIPFADIDNYRAAGLMMAHLTGLGHRHIAFLSADTAAAGEGKMLSIAARQRAYTEALEKLGVSPIIETAAHNMMDAGYTAMQALLRRKEHYTAVFCSTDMLALGAVRAIHDAGLSVPADISVAGFDGNPWAPYMTPALTTVKQAAYPRGRRAAEMIMDFVENGEIPDSTVFDAALEIGESTAVCQA